MWIINFWLMLLNFETFNFKLQFCPNSSAFIARALESLITSLWIFKKQIQHLIQIMRWECVFHPSFIIILLILLFIQKNHQKNSLHRMSWEDLKKAYLGRLETPWLVVHKLGDTHSTQVHSTQYTQYSTQVGAYTQGFGHTGLK